MSACKEARPSGAVFVWLFAWPFLLALAPPAAAQDTLLVTTQGPGIHLSLGGTLQTRLSYARCARGGCFGMGVRRARLRTNASLGRGGAYVQLGVNEASAAVLDAYVSYKPAAAWRLRLGRFTSTQPRANQPTSHTRIDAVERAAIASRWENGTLAASGRDFGLDVRYETAHLTTQLFLHNGHGSWDAASGNFSPQATDDAPPDMPRTGVAVSGYTAYRPAALPGVEAGGYLGYNGAAASPTEAFDQGRTYASYSGHVYWGAAPGSQPIRLKLDLVGIRYETLSAGALPPEAADRAAFEQHAMGAALLGALRPLPYAEAFVRAEQYDPNRHAGGDAQRFYTAGGSFSLSALQGRLYRQQRLTLAYSTMQPRAASAEAQHVLTLQAQLVF